MSPRLVTDATTLALERALDGTALQQRLIANNIANVETPGFSASHAEFEDLLRSALAAERGPGEQSHGAEPSPLARVEPRIVRSAAEPGSANGNNVDIEAEMTALSESVLRYEALTRLLRKKLQMVGTAIGDGRNG